MGNESIPPPRAVGIAYNLKKGCPGRTEDAEAEYDSFSTIKAIQQVLESAGAKVFLLEADADFTEKVKEAKPDIVFNIAEGTNGRGREAQVPAILNFLGVPFTGSDETTLCLSLDKALTKRFLSTFGIETPSYQLVSKPNFRMDRNLRFPLIMKPDCEGSGKGIGELAVAENEKQLSDTVNKNLTLYGQPVLLEEYIKGREFTVGLLGNGRELRVFEPMEIRYLDKNQKNQVYNYKVKTNYKKYIEYSCPSSLEKSAAVKMKKIAADIFTELECRDFARIDFRLSEEGTIEFIEINPLPGLAPGYSDYPMLAEFCGMSYRNLIINILGCALKRYGMPHHV